MKGIRKNYLPNPLILMILLALATIPALAHHSMSGYDFGRTLTMKASITTFAWSNPHVQIQFEVRDESGNATNWLAEGPSPGRLSKRGWNEDTLKPGDQVTIVGNPAKNGAKEMRLEEVTLADGQEISAYRNR